MLAPSNAVAVLNTRRALDGLSTRDLRTVQRDLTEVMSAAHERRMTVWRDRLDPTGQWLIDPTGQYLTDLTLPPEMSSFDPNDRALLDPPAWACLLRVLPEAIRDAASQERDARVALLRALAPRVCPVCYTPVAGDVAKACCPAHVKKLREAGDRANGEICETCGRRFVAEGYGGDDVEPLGFCSPICACASVIEDFRAIEPNLSQWPRIIYLNSSPTTTSGLMKEAERESGRIAVTWEAVASGFVAHLILPPGGHVPSWSRWLSAYRPFSDEGQGVLAENSRIQDSSFSGPLLPKPGWGGARPGAGRPKG